MNIIFSIICEVFLRKFSMKGLYTYYNFHRNRNSNLIIIYWLSFNRDSVFLLKSLIVKCQSTYPFSLFDFVENCQYNYSTQPQYHTSFWYLSSTCNAFIGCYIRHKKYIFGFDFYIKNLKQQCSQSLDKKCFADYHRHLHLWNGN